MNQNRKTVVVTGASKGMGLAIVQRLAQDGYDIIAHYNSGNIEQAQKICGEAKVNFTAFQADLSREDEIISLAQEINACGDIYGLVNNAGVCLFEDFFDISVKNYDFTFNVNMKAPFILTQRISKQMKERGIHGRIINFSSITAISASATQVHYGAAKGAVSAFTRMAAEALGKYGITVNAVMPGPTPTKHNSAYLAQDATRQELCSRMPMGTYGKPEYIADAVAYFLGEKACWTTGVLLPVDGGYLAK